MPYARGPGGGHARRPRTPRGDPHRPATLAGADRQRITELAARRLAAEPAAAPHSPYGDGHAAERPVEAIRHLVDHRAAARIVRVGATARARRAFGTRARDGLTPYARRGVRACASGHMTDDEEEWRRATWLFERRGDSNPHRQRPPRGRCLPASAAAFLGSRNERCWRCRLGSRTHRFGRAAHRRRLG